MSWFALSGVASFFVGSGCQRVVPGRMTGWFAVLELEPFLACFLMVLRSSSVSMLPASLLGVPSAGGFSRFAQVSSPSLFSCLCNSSSGEYPLWIGSVLRSSLRVPHQGHFLFTIGWSVVFL